MARGKVAIDPATGEPKPKKPAVPRPVYLVYNTKNAVGDNGRLSKEAFLVATRSAKEALEYIDGSPDASDLSYVTVMLK